MTPLLTVPVQGYEVCRPAAGTRAASNSQDFGTSHWQLMIDGYTSFRAFKRGRNGRCWQRPEIGAAPATASGFGG
jgi:hypothetical protein